MMWALVMVIFINGQYVDGHVDPMASKRDCVLKARAMRYGLEHLGYTANISCVSKDRAGHINSLKL